MSFGKKVAVAVSLDDDLMVHLQTLKDMEFLRDSEIHLIHVFNTISYAVGFAEAPLIYPVEEDRRNIEKAVLGRLETLWLDVLPVGFRGKAIFKCLFHEDPKQKFANYLDEIKADLCIVATRKRRGLFESSFAHYLEKHAHAHLIVLKTDVKD
jgi:hypothetical protein